MSRRYRVTFECAKAKVGDLWGLLSGDVDGLNAAPGADGQSRMTFTCVQDQLTAVIGIVADPAVVASHIVVRPEEAAADPARPFARPAVDSRTLDTSHVPITRLPPSHPRIRRTGSRMYTRDSRAGKLIMEIAERKAIFHNPDVQDAFDLHDLSHNGIGTTLSRMVGEGSLMRMHRGAYRLPTDAEAADLIRRRSGATNPDHNGQE